MCVTVGIPEESSTTVVSMNTTTTDGENEVHRVEKHDSGHLSSLLGSTVTKVIADRRSSLNVTDDAIAQLYMM